MIRGIKRFIARKMAWKKPPVSSDYKFLDKAAESLSSSAGWHQRAVAERQDAAYQELIRDMYAGQPRQDMLVAAEAVRRTGLKDALVLEVGCGSAYYREILSHLLQHDVRYVGLDYSRAMIQVALDRYGSSVLVVGDATALPFGARTFDVVFNGVSLMHILRYEAAILESRRVARDWCIFHTVPVLQKRSTTILQKRAYGEMTVEIIFNEHELWDILERRGLAVRHVLDSIPYDLETILGEPTKTKTYVCRVAE